MVVIDQKNDNKNIRIMLSCNFINAVKRHIFILFIDSQDSVVC